jgi:hypothetical protein
MWLSADPAMGEYIPQAPINDEAKKYNQNLPGMGGVYNYVNLHVYRYAGNNPVKLVDPDGEASILKRSIVTTKIWYLETARKLGFKHYLVDKGDLDEVRDVSHFLGTEWGFSELEDSKGKTYEIVYSNMDDALTEKAIENVRNQERFGGGTDKAADKRAGEKYVPLINDCNGYTNAVYGEYKQLWKEQYKKEHEGEFFLGIKTFLAWNEHEKSIKEQQGETISF